MTKNEPIFEPLDFDKLYQADVARRKAEQLRLDALSSIQEQRKETVRKLETLLKLAEKI